MTPEAFRAIVRDSHPRTGPLLDRALAEAHAIDQWEFERDQQEAARQRRENNQEVFDRYIRNLFDAEGTR